MSGGVNCAVTSSLVDGANKSTTVAMDLNVGSIGDRHGRHHIFCTNLRASELQW